MVYAFQAQRVVAELRNQVGRHFALPLRRGGGTRESSCDQSRRYAVLTLQLLFPCSDTASSSDEVLSPVAPLLSALAFNSSSRPAAP